MHGLTWARLGVAVLILDRLESLGRAYVSPGSFGFAWVHAGERRSSRAHSGSRRLTWEGVKDNGFFRVRLGSLHAPRCRRVHLYSLGRT